jgi:transposase-like protein
VKYGLYSGDKQRYRCSKCNRTFSDAAIEKIDNEKYKRLVLHLLLSGCHKREIARVLKLEDMTIKKWMRLYLKNLKNVLPQEQLLSIHTLITIYEAIEKGRISKLHRKRRPGRYFY